MLSIVKHYRQLPNGELIRLPDEVHEIPDTEPDRVISDRTDNGRRQIVYGHNSAVGRPINPLRGRCPIIGLQCGAAFKMCQLEYNGVSGGLR